MMGSPGGDGHAPIHCIDIHLRVIVGVISALDCLPFPVPSLLCEFGWLGCRLVKNSSFPQLARIVSQPKKSVPKATGALSMSLLRYLLAQVKMRGYLGEDVLEKCDAVLRSGKG